VPEEAQVQAAPPLERPVTRPDVASEPAEQAGNVAVEIDLLERPTVRQTKRVRLGGRRGPGRKDREDSHYRSQNRLHGFLLGEHPVSFPPLSARGGGRGDQPTAIPSFRAQHQCDLLGLPLGERELAAGRLESVGLGGHVEFEVGLELAGSETAVVLLLEVDIRRNAVLETVSD